MRKFVALMIGLAFALSMVLTSALPASALSGVWSKSEFNSLCTVKLDQQFGQLCSGDGWNSGATQTQAENICDCTGDKISGWSNNGHDFKNVQYNGGPVGVNVIITYRKWDSTEPWRAYDKLWCDSSGCSDYAS